LKYLIPLLFFVHGIAFASPLPLSLAVKESLIHLEKDFGMDTEIVSIEVNPQMSDMSAPSTQVKVHIYFKQKGTRQKAQYCCHPKEGGFSCH
jgi:hypothetical protein